MTRPAQTPSPLLTVLFAFLALLASHLAGAADSVTFFHNDISGTPLAATDANGALVWKEQYRPYGEQLNNQPAGANNKLWFGGKPYEPKSGLSYMGARYYHPALGRFMGVDPAEIDLDNVHSLNRYAYANNNPYRFVDPDGHSPIDVAFLIYDLGKLGAAVYSGTGVGAAAADVVSSVVGVASPIPGTGQALKGARAAEKAVDGGRGVKEVAEFGNRTQYTPGGRFSQSTKETAAERAGRKCEYCGVETVVAKKSERGVSPPRNEGQTDHIVAKKSGGLNSPDNAAHACRDCNRRFSDSC